MALRTPPRPAPAAAPARRRGGAGKIIVAALMVAALGIGYITLRPTSSGPQAQPTPPPTLPADYFHGYAAFFNDHTATLPEDLSVDDVRQLANDCAAGAMPPNAPAYLSTDNLLRARGGWVCLVGPPVAAPDLSCNAPGTDGGPGRLTVQRGHLIAVILGGHGDVRDERGGCMNITPLDRQTNAQMRDGMEKEARTRASAGETVLYLSIPVYRDTRLTPSSVYVFAISAARATMGQYDNPKHLWESGTSAL